MVDVASFGTLKARIASEVLGLKVGHFYKGTFHA